MAYAIPGVQGGQGALGNDTPPVSNDGQARSPYASQVAFQNNSKPDLVKNDALLDPSAARRENAGVNQGAENSVESAGQDPEVTVNTQSVGGIATDDDWRVRISLPTKSTALYRGNPGVMNQLLRSGIDGVIFPYTPTIQISHNARYSEQALTHSNYKSYFYEGSDVSAIQISGDFTAQNQEEAAYVLAAIYFFRAATKMFFGADESPAAGTPPPIVFLDGYGDMYFPHVPCVITTFQHTMPSDVDYMQYDLYRTRVPTISQISVTLQPVYSRKMIHEDFTLTNYGAGYLKSWDKKGGFL